MGDERDAREPLPDARFAELWHGALVRQIERWREAGVAADDFAQPFFNAERPADGTDHEIDGEFGDLTAAVQAEGSLCVHAANQLDRSIGVMRRPLDQRTERGRACDRARSAFDSMVFTRGDVTINGAAATTGHLRDLLEHFDAYLTGEHGHYVKDVGLLSATGSHLGTNPTVIWSSSTREGSEVWIALHLDAVEAWERDHVAPLLRR